MNFKEKYLKYKIKYINLKKVGGVMNDVAVGSIVENRRTGEKWGTIIGDQGKTWLLNNYRHVKKNTIGKTWRAKVIDGSIIESIEEGNTWGKIIADIGNAWLLDSNRIAKKNTMGQKWQVKVFDVIQEEAKEEAKEGEGKEETEEAYILEDAPLIFPLGDAAIGKTVESISGEKWGTIIGDLGKTWLLDNIRHVKKNTIGKTWQIFGGTNVTVYPAKRVIHYIIDGHGGRTIDQIIKERGILYNLYTQQCQPLSCHNALTVTAALKNPNISNIQPVIQYDHNYSRIYHDFQLSCDLPRIGSGDCFSDSVGNFKSGITRVKGDIYNEKIWDFDIHGVNNEYNLSRQPKVSEVIESIIKPDFLALAQCDTFEKAINKGYICSLHCLFCLNQMY